MKRKYVLGLLTVAAASCRVGRLQRYGRRNRRGNYGSSHGKSGADGGACQGNYRSRGRGRRKGDSQCIGRTVHHRTQGSRT